MASSPIWKVGDLGRFIVEDKKRPRFEVLGSKPGRGIAVWYGGSRTPVFIPEDVFKARCVNYWTIEVVPKLEPWMIPGVVFKIPDPRASKITQGEVLIGYTRQISQMDVKDHSLRIRRIGFDHASCFDEDARVLVMVPLKILVSFGLQVITKWDHLNEDLLFGDDEDPIQKLLGSLERKL